MTPEERTKETFAKIDRAYWSRDEILEAAIRAAENDALEQAAVECEDISFPDSESVAQAIRALKHKEAIR